MNLPPGLPPVCSLCAAPVDEDDLQLGLFQNRPCCTHCWEELADAGKEEVDFGNLDLSFSNNLLKDNSGLSTRNSNGRNDNSILSLSFASSRGSRTSHGGGSMVGRLDDDFDEYDLPMFGVRIEAAEDRNPEKRSFSRGRRKGMDNPELKERSSRNRARSHPNPTRKRRAEHSLREGLHREDEHISRRNSKSNQVTSKSSKRNSKSNTHNHHNPPAPHSKSAYSKSAYSKSDLPPSNNYRTAFITPHALPVIAGSTAAVFGGLHVLNKPKWRGLLKRLVHTWTAPSNFDHNFTAANNGDGSADANGATSNGLTNPNLDPNSLPAAFRNSYLNGIQNAYGTGAAEAVYNPYTGRLENPANLRGSGGGGSGRNDSANKDHDVNDNNDINSSNAGGEGGADEASGDKISSGNSSSKSWFGSWFGGGETPEDINDAENDADEQNDQNSLAIIPPDPEANVTRDRGIYHNYSPPSADIENLMKEADKDLKRSKKGWFGGMFSSGGFVGGGPFGDSSGRNSNGGENDPDGNANNPATKKLSRRAAQDLINNPSGTLTEHDRAIMNKTIDNTLGFPSELALWLKNHPIKMAKNTLSYIPIVGPGITYGGGLVGAAAANVRDGLQFAWDEFVPDVDVVGHHVGGGEVHGHY